MVRSWMNYVGAPLLILMGVFPRYWDPDLSTAKTMAGLLWRGMAFDDPPRERRYRRRYRDASLRAAPAPCAGYRRHRGSRRAAARPFAGGDLPRPRGAGIKRGGIATNVPSTVAGSSLMKDSLRIATKEVRENLYGVTGSLWALFCAIALALTSSNLLLTDERLSFSDQSEILYTVTSLAPILGLLAAGMLATSSVAGKKGWATLESMLLPTKRGTLLLGKVCGVMAAWLLTFVISAPYILVAGFRTSVPWAALVYTFVLGDLCVAGFAALIVGISTLSRSGRGVKLISSAIFTAMAAPTLLGAASKESWFGEAYNALSPIAQARLSLESVIVDKESVLVQLPHIGALAAFALIAGVFATFAARGGLAPRTL